MKRLAKFVDRLADVGGSSTYASFAMLLCGAGIVITSVAGALLVFAGDQNNAIRSFVACAAFVVGLLAATRMRKPKH